MKVRCLHTNPSDCVIYDELFAKSQRQIEVSHVVRADFLGMAQSGDRETSREVAQEMAQAGTISLCTCTTLAPFVPIDTTRFNITRPAIIRAAALGGDVLVALKSRHLHPVMQTGLSRVAAEMAMPLRARFVLCTGTTSADFANTILAEVAQTSRPDSILLGQASMRGTVALLRDVGCPVLATPDCAVAAVLDRLDAA